MAYAFGLRDPGGEDSSPLSYILALDIRTGNRLWSYQRAGAAINLLACTQDGVFVAEAHTVQRIEP